MVMELEREGDFREWISPHLASMGYLAARMAPADDRDDIVQEALVRAWRRWSTYDAARGTPRAWLLAIVADRARRTRRWHLRHPSVAIGAETLDRPVDRGPDLETALRTLSGRQRLAVDLFYFVDLSIVEAAHVMGCSEGTVKSTLADAREKLRKVLTER